MDLEALKNTELFFLQDVRGDDDRFLISLENNLQGSRNRRESKTLRARAVCWTVCSAAALYTTKQLLCNHGYHYPATIALIDFGCIIFTYMLAMHRGRRNAHTNARNTASSGLSTPEWNQILPTSTWKGMVFAALTAALSLPFLFQSLLHLPSLPVLVMLFPVIYATESVILFLHSVTFPQYQQHGSLDFPWHTLATTMASITILFYEYRLMVPGLVFGIASLLLLGLSKALFGIESSKLGLDGWQLTREAKHNFRMMTALFGIIFSAIMIYIFEHSVTRYVSVNTVEMIFIQVFLVVITVSTGSSLLVYSPISFEDLPSNLPATSLFEWNVLASVTSSFLVVLAAIYSSPKIVVCMVQFVAFAAAILCVLGGSQLHSTFTKAKNLPHHRSSRLLGEPCLPTSGVTKYTIASLAVFMAATLSVLESRSLSSIFPTQAAKLDLSYKAPSVFDIVVSTYLEEPESIKTMLTSIRSTSLLSTLQSRVILYTKEQAADIVMLETTTGADLVVKLPNAGREGATYLHHIVANWDTLAEKTMFIQAHAHNIRELIPRIDSYLVPNTGMLSLGFTGMTCRCGSCQDRWNWEDRQSVITDIYASVYNHTCKEDTPILLSYKGQFVASGQRIRGIPKSVYERLLRALTTREGWVGNSTLGATVYEENVDNPVFGFTMERLWGLVMQCATNSIVASRCPSLLSGKGFGGSVNDCQCLDSA